MHINNPVAYAAGGSQDIGGMNKNPEHFRLWEYAAFGTVTLAVMVLCVCTGSVALPLKDIADAALHVFARQQVSQAHTATILSIRIPRVLCVALEGASLSLSGAAMQGLLRNPLADGSTLGVSSGASLGAVLAIALGISFPFLPFAGTMVMAVLFAFLSLLLILTLAWRMDSSLSTNTIILIGVIFSMFVSSLINVIVTFASDKLHSITFWTMGSLSSSTYEKALLLLAVLAVFGGVIFWHAAELNAFAMGEDTARHIGINVRRTRLLILIAVSCIVGVCVAIGGAISFVGLVTPHMTRMIVGPNHRRLLPASLFAGAVFLMLADLAARILLNPIELPIGVVTSMTGAVVFILIFLHSRKEGGYA